MNKKINKAEREINLVYKDQSPLRKYGFKIGQFSQIICINILLK